MLENTPIWGQKLALRREIVHDRGEDKKTSAFMFDKKYPQRHERNKEHEGLQFPASLVTIRSHLFP